MINKKILDNVEPYNDLYYRSCFYNSLFPILGHFNKDIMHFLLNDIVAYYNDSNRDGIQFDINYLTIKPLEEVYKDVGIYCDTMWQIENIVEEIIKSLDEDKPIIVWIDRFYESITPETYKKLHWLHTLSVYGYDRGERTFNIIEHRHMDNLAYRKCAISFEDMENCFKGFEMNFKQKDEIPSLYSFSSSEQIVRVENIDYMQSFKDSLIQNREAIVGGVECLKSFAANFEIIALDESQLNSNIEQLVDIFKNIMNVKKVEKYKLEKLVGPDDQAVVLLGEIIDRWTSVWKATTKYMYTMVYKETIISNLVNTINNICHIEDRYVARLFSLTRNA
ncbi:MAG: BtrH N-terminal domain-containing protein [Clostridia bacterium]|nr:BtrH N-terminal domain-containing protein [Clostridia bacterium]